MTSFPRNENSKMRRRGESESSRSLFRDRNHFIVTKFNFYPKTFQSSFLPETTSVRKDTMTSNTCIKQKDPVYYSRKLQPIK